MIHNRVHEEPAAYSPRLVAVLLSFVGLGTSCSDHGIGPTGVDRPAISNVAVAASPYNALSTVVSFTATRADSVRVVYWAGGEPPLATPYYRLRGDTARIATLGLRPRTTYYHTVEAVGSDVRVASDTLPLATGDVPQSLQSVHLDVTGLPTGGYVLTPVTFFGADTVAYALAFDASGQIRWYRAFNEGVPAGETKQQPNGDFTIFLGLSQGWQPTYGRYVEFMPSGEIVRSYAASPPFYTDNHEILLSGIGDTVATVHLFGYELRQVDLSARGGPVDALVAGHVIERQSVTGQVEFLWNAWDHFVLADWIEPTGVNPPLDFDHPNSLDFDVDGSYVVSFRHMGEITKIDRRTGTIVWRLGGRNNQFTFLNDPLGGFSGQHSVRVLENGNLLVYDNGLRHTPPESRAVEYRLDAGMKTATMVWQYRRPAPVFTPFLGSVQRYENGNTFVAFSTANLIVEVDPNGTPVWQGVLNLGAQTNPIIFQALKVPSLYRYERP